MQYHAYMHHTVVQLAAVTIIIIIHKGYNYNTCLYIMSSVVHTHCIDTILSIIVFSIEIQHACKIATGPIIYTRGISNLHYNQWQYISMALLCLYACLISINSLLLNRQIHMLLCTILCMHIIIVQDLYVVSVSFCCSLLVSLTIKGCYKHGWYWCLSDNTYNAIMP